MAPLLDTFAFPIHFWESLRGRVLAFVGLMMATPMHISFRWRPHKLHSAARTNLLQHRANHYTALNLQFLLHCTLHFTAFCCTFPRTCITVLHACLRIAALSFRIRNSKRQISDCTTPTVCGRTRAKTFEQFQNSASFLALTEAQHHVRSLARFSLAGPSPRVFSVRC